MTLVQVGALNIFRDVAMVVAILVSAITELCIWRHISGAKHDNTVKMMVYPDLLMVKDYDGESIEKETRDHLVMGTHQPQCPLTC